MSLPMSSEIRKKAKKSARTYLEMRGFIVLELNWSLSRSKIDLIAQKTGLIYFISINYQADEASDLPVDPLTRAKLDQLNRNAEAWTSESKYTGKYVFASIELAGPNFSVIGFNEDLI
jgi:Holliday junction resolvase-like predicted endonuclease